MNDRRFTPGDEQATDAPNPYEPPLQATRSAPPPSFLRGNPLRAPAIALLMMATPSLAGILIGPVVSAPDVERLSWNTLALYTIFAAWQVAIILGSINMLRMKGYQLAFVGAVAACIPILAPCICITLPFGIWAVFELRTVQVRARFYENEHPPEPEEARV